MSDDKNKVSDKASEFARNIWLAGVGAYGRAVGEAQDRLEKAGVETPKLFRELVKAGAALEDDARSAIVAGQEARNSVEDRINRVRENFRLQLTGRSDDIQALHDKIDRLSSEIAELRVQLDTLNPYKAATKAKPKATAKTKNSRAKTTAKKAPAKTKTKAKTKTRTRRTR